MERAGCDHGWVHGVPIHGKQGLSTGLSGRLTDVGRIDTHSSGNAFAIGRIGLSEVPVLPDLDLPRHALHGAGNVINEAPLCSIIHQTVQITGLGVVVVAVTVVIAIGVALDTQWRFDTSCIVRCSSSAAGRLFFHMMGTLAEFERNLIRERTRAGLAATKRRGRKPGRKRKLGEQDLVAARALVTNENITVVEVAERLGVSSATLYRELPGGRGGVG